VLPSVGDKNPLNFAFAGCCTLSEYFPPSLESVTEWLAMFKLVFVV